jgi:hypothetical protein
MYRMDRDNALRILGEIEDTVRKTAPEALEELRGSLTAVRDAVNAGLWEDAWANYQLLADVIGKLDPVISAYVTRETREAYEKAAEPEETLSYYARKVLEGERSPATPPDGLVAASRALEQIKVAEEADWEKSLKEILKPVEADWEKSLKEYFTGSPSGSGGLGGMGNPGSPEVYEPLDRFIEELKRRYPKERYPELYDLLEDLRDEMVKVTSRAVRGLMADTLVRLLDYASVLERTRRWLSRDDYNKLYSLSVEFCDYIAGILRETVR